MVDIKEYYRFSGYCALGTTDNPLPDEYSQEGCVEPITLRAAALLAHCRDQFELAREAGDVREEWRDAEDFANFAEGFIAAKDFGRAFEALFILGDFCGGLSKFPDKLVHNAIDAKVASDYREFPLRKRNLTIRIAKTFVQGIARKKWAEDLGNTIRTAPMCEIVWKEIIHMNWSDEIWEIFPDEPKGLREWIKPVAPPYAQKGGRPKKK